MPSSPTPSCNWPWGGTAEDKAEDLLFNPFAHLLAVWGRQIRDNRGEKSLLSAPLLFFLPDIIDDFPALGCPVQLGLDSKSNP